MAVIPGADTLGQSEGAPDIAPVTYPRQFGRPNQVGEAISETAEKRAAAIQKGQDQSAEFEYGATKSDFLIGKANLLQQVAQDPDWKTADARYSEGISELQSTASSNLQNPKMQQRFGDEAKVEAADGLLKIKEFQRGREVQDGRATIDNTLAANKTAALADPASAPAIIASTQSLLDGGVSKGYITEPEGVKLRLNWTQDYGKGYVDSLPDSEAVQVLGKSLPQRGAGQAAPVGIKVALLGQESGNNSNAPTSVTGAVGPGQVEPATFKRFAKPGESIDNPDDNRAVSGRYVDYLSGLPNVQGDPARIAVGYFSGEKNIAPLGSPTPWIRDKPSPTGTPGKVKLTSSYVSDVVGRTGKTQVADNGAEAPLSAPTGTPADFLDAPTRAVMLREAQARMRSDNAAGVQAYASSVRDNISYLQSGGDPSKVSLSSAEIGAHVPGEEGASLSDEFAHALDYNKAVTQVATSTPAQVQAILDGHAPTGPGDFRENAASFEALQKAAQARQGMLFGTATRAGDPAAYATSAFKDVGAAFSLANSQPGPQTFDGYVTRLNGAYQTLGVPPEFRSILPRAAAAGMVSEITSSTPQEALSVLARTKAEAGKWWPAVYRDLARSGLPASFQAVSIVAPKDQTTMVAALQRDADAKAKGSGSLSDSMKGLRDSDGASVTETVDKAIDADGGMTNLRSSFGVAGRSGVDMFNGVREAVKNTALYLYAKGGIDAPTAAAKATAMVTGTFDFVQQPGHPPARLPKGSTQDFQEAAEHTLDGLTGKDVQPYRHEADADGHPIEIPKDQLSEHALRGAKGAYWVAIPGADGQGAVRAMDPQTGLPVVLAGGKPLDIPFARFNFLATQSRKTAASAEDKSAAAMGQEAMEK